MTDAQPPLTRFDAHTFDGDDGAPMDSACSLCSYPRASIIHHPSRIKPAVVMVRRPRASESQAG